MAADSTSPIDPDRIASQTFNRARRGFDADEVRAFLLQVASQTRDLLRKHDDLGRRVEELERRAADPRELDEETVTALLGEQTAKLLVDARRTANEMVSEAEAAVAELRTSAEEEADATRAAADAYAENTRSLADEADEKIRADARAFADQLRETAERETTEQRTAADEYERMSRENLTAEITAERAKVENDVGEMRRQAETVLAERTAEAEETATRIRAEADEYRESIRADADAYDEKTRADADAYAADTRAAADSYRDRLRAESDAAMELTIKEAKEEGRTMVQEAREYRERVIADLADRRRAARAELERMAATRDALAVTLTDVRIQVERAHGLLQDADIDPVEVGDLSTDRRALVPSPIVEDTADLDEEDEEPDDDDGDDGAGEAPVGVDAEADGEADGDGDDGDGADEALDVEDDPVDADIDADADADDEGDADAAADDADADLEADDEIDAEADAGDDDEPGGEVIRLHAVAAERIGEPAETETEDADAPEAAEVTDTAADPEPDPAAPVAAVEYDAADSESASAEADSDGDESADDGEVAPGIDDLFARIRAEQADPGTEGEDETDDDDEEGDGVDPTGPGATGPTTDSTNTGSSDADAIDSGPESESAEPSAGTERDPDDDDLLELRDGGTDEVERQLARRLKRELADEQNELLDALRRSKGDPQRDEVLPTEDDHLARYRDALLEDLRVAERTGAGFYGDAPDRTADITDVATEFASDLVRQFRGRLERAFDDGGGEDDIAEAVRTLYREWKTQRIADAARHFVVTAFSRGVLEAASDGTGFRWLVDHEGDPAPDCEDNALAGRTERGDPFPTGDLYPPIHPGCRCLLVPTDD